MKNKVVMVFMFVLANGDIFSSTLLNNYKKQIQEKIDNNSPVSIGTFTNFIDNLEQRLQSDTQKFPGLKPYVQQIVTFVKNISLQESKIIEQTIPEYGESFTIDAAIHIANHRIPIRFTIVSNVNDVEYYSFAVHIPDDIKIVREGLFGAQILNNFFKERWIVFTLFDHKDSVFGSVIKGLNIIAEVDPEKVAKNMGDRFEWMKKLIGKVPVIRFSGSVPLSVVALLPFFTGANLPKGVTFESLRSLMRFKSVMHVNKNLYTNEDSSVIKAIIIESCDITADLGTMKGLQDYGLDVTDRLSFELGVTMRIKNTFGPDIVSYGGIETSPVGFVIHARTEEAIKNPFGIPWLTFHDMGIDFPLDFTGTVIAEIGMRAKVGLGKSIFEVAGKADLNILKKSGFVLHGQAEKVPFSAFTQIVQNNNARFGWLNGLELNSAQITIACGDTVIGGKEFKAGLTVRAQVDHPLLNKQAGFQLYAYNTGTSYQLFGNGYLPKVKTKDVVFEGVNSRINSKLQFYHEGPRLEFSYAFDMAFERFLQAVIKANGRIKIGSFFDGMADIDISTVTLARNAISDWKHFFSALLRDQKIIVSGKLFNLFGAQLYLVDLVDKGVYANVGFSQNIVTEWEKKLRHIIIGMKESIKQRIQSLDKEIKKITENLDKNALKALERAADLALENERLREENKEIQNRINQTTWKQIYKVVPLKIKQGYNATMIASNADLLNTITVHGSFSETLASTFTQLRKQKDKALALVDGIANVTQFEVGLFGIEKIEGYGNIQDILYRAKPLLLKIELKVMGQKKVISGIPFDGARLFESITNLIRVVASNILNIDISPQEINVDSLIEITGQNQQPTDNNNMRALPWKNLKALTWPEGRSDTKHDNDMKDLPSDTEHNVDLLNDKQDMNKSSASTESYIHDSSKGNLIKALPWDESGFKRYEKIEQF